MARVLDRLLFGGTDDEDNLPKRTPAFEITDDGTKVCVSGLPDEYTLNFYDSVLPLDKIRDKNVARKINRILERYAKRAHKLNRKVVALEKEAENVNKTNVRELDELMKLMEERRQKMTGKQIGLHAMYATQKDEAHDSIVRLVEEYTSSEAAKEAERKRHAKK